MSLSIRDVEKIALLARLELTDAEKNLYQEQLSAILEYAQRLNQLDTTGVAPTASAVDLRNVLREDVVEPGLSLEDALFNAVDEILDQFRIQAVLDES
ncbi:MAG TPA: Asp-tRNA(Asn)/Glu-tRNA(Gln) amidotransferase subunit GatC [candidate division Zixibacteria bacterium]|nr:Asp-tRNA(Asn)/Glu-tRNA(Gln) amidotransferase subunit GatC [candidate division Zixibacteria bacterium]